MQKNLENIKEYYKYLKVIKYYNFEPRTKGYMEEYDVYGE